MYAVFSITASERASLSRSLLSSLKACLRFLSADSLALLLLSQVLRRSMVCFIEEERGFPIASVLPCPIIVASPMSCTASDVGNPVLALSSYSSFVNARVSDPKSTIRSCMTKPHPLQNFSPVELSVTRESFPHRMQLPAL